MADKSPWIDWSWLKVGPVLKNEEDRAAYEQQRQYPQQGPSMDDYMAGRRRMERDAVREQNRVNAMNDEREAMMNQEEMLRNQQAQQAAATRAINSTPFADRSLWDQMFNSTPAEFQDWQTKMAAPPAAAGQGDGKPRGIGTDENTPAQTIMQPVQGPPRPPVAPVSPSPNDGDQSSVPDPLEEIRRQRAMIDAIYPQPPANDIGQAEIDAEMAKERERANLMAQLAFFSGITSGAGGQWEGVGAGMAAAGGAYQQGFNRYQKALESRAKRMQSQADSQYENDLKRSDAAVGLYKQQQDLEKSRLSEARQRQKDRQSDIDEWFKERLKLEAGNDLQLPDQSRVNDIMRDWRISRDRGEIVEINKRPEEK